MKSAERAVLVESHGWIVAQFVAKYEGRGNGADLAEAGFLGLCEAAARFRPGRGVQFGTYAWNWVKGAVLEEIRTAHVVPISKRAALGKTQSPPTPPRMVRLPQDDELLSEAQAQTRGLLSGRSSPNVVRAGLFIDGGGEQAADAPRRRRIALQRITALPSAELRRVAFRALKGRTVEQIAQGLELPPGRVIQLLFEAQQRLAAQAPTEREAA